MYVGVLMACLLPCSCMYQTKNILVYMSTLQQLQFEYPDVEREGSYEKLKCNCSYTHTSVFMEATGTFM